VIVFIVLIISNSLFTVDEREHALKFRFGEIIQTDYGPGLHFKVPFVNNVQKYSKQILTINNPLMLHLSQKLQSFDDYCFSWQMSFSLNFENN
jgi:membrane protease subunit HflC